MSGGGVNSSGFFMDAEKGLKDAAPVCLSYGKVRTGNGARQWICQPVLVYTQWGKATVVSGCGGAFPKLKSQTI